MIPYFPKQFSNKAIGMYFVSLALVSIIFMSYALSLKFIIAGIIGVCAFFYFSTELTKKWHHITDEKFAGQVFLIALVIRLLWVVFSYFFYIAQTGLPFEYEAADSAMYFDEGSWLSMSSWDVINDYLFSTSSYSDSGYKIYLTCLYKLIGPNIIVTRVIKACLGAFTCVLIFRLAKRNFGESTGRMAAIFCMLMPNMIYYCGLHVKETEMVFLTVAFLERADYLLRSKHYTVWTIALPFLLAVSLFFFRTVLGAVAVFAFFTALLFTSTKIIGWGKKVLLIAWGIVAIGYLAGGTIMTEVESTWEDRSENQDAKRQHQVNKGVDWAKYATGGVMAPMIFIVPFSTMVDVDEQYNQQLIHGGNFVKNIMGVFILIALFYSIFKNKNWRDFSLIGAFTIGYLMVIAFSGYANAERFHFPALPGLIMIWAYGVSLVNKKNYKYVNYWFYFVIVMEFGWAFFKLGSRGIVG